MYLLRMAFTLHPKLVSGTFAVGSIAGCQLLLKNNALFPWFLLVPEVEPSIEDLHQLDEPHYWEVMAAMRRVSEFLSYHFKPEKLNIGCIGNQVRQMHIHIVGRTSQDPAWPSTVWAFEGKEAYSLASAEAIILSAQTYLKIV